jgi:uncharacterized protein YkwD
VFRSGVLAVLVLGSAIFASAFAAARPAPLRPPSGLQEALAPEAIERALFELINKERAARDLPALKLSSSLSDVARKHSEEMARLGRLGHESAAGGLLNERLKRAGIPNVLNAENVVRSTSFDPAFIHEAVMRSEGHRENILLPGVDEVGVGVVRGPRGDYYITQDLIRSVTWLDEAAVRAAIAAALADVRRSQGLPPLLVLEELSLKADAFARLKAEGRPIPPLPPEFGAARIEFFSGPDLDQIGAAVRDKAQETYRMAGFGVHVGPTGVFPAGAYQVCLVLLAGSPALLWDGPQRVEAVLRAVNEVRALKQAGPLALDAALTRTADILAERYLSKRPPSGDQVSPSQLMSLTDPPDVGTVVVIYETSDLERLAPDLRRHLQNLGGLKIGISVKPAGAGLTVNFVVVLLAGDQSRSGLLLMLLSSLRNPGSTLTPRARALWACSQASAYRPS